jgi:hypothetical protein
MEPLAGRAWEAFVIVTTMVKIGALSGYVFLLGTGSSFDGAEQFEI